jgi:hypothetical protein
MAEVFTRKLSRSITNSWTSVGAYTVPASTSSTLIGLTIANTYSTAIAVDVSVYDGANNTYIVKGTTLNVGDTLVAVGGEQKIVLVTGDEIQVKTDNALHTCDVVLSLLELS